MTAADPNGMPAVEEAPTAETFRHSVISTGISNHLRGSNFPVLVYEPRKMAIECNRTSITEPCRTHPDHVASEDPAADSRPIRSLLDVQFDLSAWQQPVVCLYQGAARRHVDQPCAMPGPYRR